MKFSRKTVKVGTFTLILTAVVLAVVIAVNLFASELPAGIKSIDTTKEKIYTIGEETKALLKNVKDEVEIYLLVENGSETESTSTVEGLIDQYVGENSNIKYKRIDPAIYPDFSKSFSEDTPSANSVIVSCGTRSRMIQGNEWYMYETDQGRLTADQYNTYAQMMYSYYGQAPEATELFLGETNLTSAVAYVTSENTNKIYTLTGHGEREVSAGYTQVISDANIDCEALNLLTGDGTIPADCSLIIINYPSQDITEKEAETLSDYYTNGGSILLVTSLEYTWRGAEPNIEALANTAGMKTVDGLIFEGDSSSYQMQPHYLVPSLSSSAPEEMKSESALTYFMPFAHGIEKLDGTGTEYHEILTTSDSSFIKEDITNIQTAEKEENDTDGPFAVAVLSTLDSEESESQFFWFSSPAFLEKDYDYGGNSFLFKSIINMTCEGGASVSIDPKVISSEYLIVSEQQANVWKAVFIAVIPLSVVAAGFVIWMVRRKKR